MLLILLLTVRVAAQTPSKGSLTLYYLYDGNYLQWHRLTGEVHHCGPSQHPRLDGQEAQAAWPPRAASEEDGGIRHPCRALSALRISQEVSLPHHTILFKRVPLMFSWIYRTQYISLLSCSDELIALPYLLFHAPPCTTSLLHIVQEEALAALLEGGTRTLLAAPCRCYRELGPRGTSDLIASHVWSIDTSYLPYVNLCRTLMCRVLPFQDAATLCYLTLYAPKVCSARLLALLSIVLAVISNERLLIM